MVANPLLAGSVVIAVLLSGCSVTSRDALPEGADGMVCVRGHDAVEMTGEYPETEFVCDEYLPKAQVTP